MTPWLRSTPEPVQEGRTALSGCLLIVLGPVIGMALAVLQDVNTVDAWSYCSNLGVQVSSDIANTGQVWLGSLLLRAVVYAVGFLVGVGIAWLVCRRCSLTVRAVASCALGLIVCALVFWGDYALNNGMTHGFYLPSRCPGGRPPWWPALLPLRVSGRCIGELCSGR
jgi:hypothetical protein